MNHLLKLLFQSQHFSPNERLTSLIRDTERRCSALDDEDLLLVNAAGEPHTTLAPLENQDESDNTL